MKQRTIANSRDHDIWRPHWTSFAALMKCHVTNPKINRVFKLIKIHVYSLG